MRPVLLFVPLPWYHFTGGSGFYFARLPIYSYGVMLGLSLIVGWYLVLGLCERDGMNREQAGRLYVWTAVCSVIAARLLYVLTNLDRFDSVLDVFRVWEGGLVAYGGFIGGFLTGVFGARRFGIRLLAWADCVVPSLGTGLFFTRMGCLLYGCDFGRPVLDGSLAARWALRFPRGAPAFVEQVDSGLLAPGAAASLPVHPTQIYEGLIGLFLFGLVMLVRRYRQFSGQVFCAFTMAYGVLRFLVETLRADSQRGEIGPLSTSQFLGLVTFVLAGAYLVFLYRRWRRDPRAARYWELPPLSITAPGAAPSPGPAAAVAAARPRRRRKR